MTYNRDMQTVVELPAFIAAAEEAGMSEEERAEVVNAIAATPDMGELMVGTGGARKFRVAGRGKGKSGGYRVVSYFSGGAIPVFLITVFSKGDQANLSAAGKTEVKKITAELANYGKD